MLSSWKEAGESVPFTFGDLIAYTSFTNDIPWVIRSAFGTTWEKWFTEAPTPETTVPKQVAVLFYQVLERLKKSWEDEQAIAQQISAEAANSYSNLCGAVKKRRAQAADIEMS